MSPDTTNIDGQTIESGYMVANDYNFTYLAAGKGPLVLLFHGFPDNPYGFSSQIRALAASGYRAVAPFKRGFAPRDNLFNPIQHAALYVQDAIALINAFNEEQIILIGHDWGAGAVYGAARLIPEKVSAIITMAIPLSAAFFNSYITNAQQMKRSWYLFYFQSQYAVEGLKYNDYAMIDFLWNTWSPGWEDYDGRLQSVKETFRKPGAAEAAVEYYRQSFGNYQIRDSALQKIQAALYDKEPFTVPTLYLHGSADGCIGAENVEGMEQLFSGKFEKHIIPGAGHFIHMEKPGIVNDHILGFLQTL